MIQNDDVFGRGMAFPPRVGEGGRVMMSSGEQNIRESIEVILKTSRQERLRLPEFGGGLRRYLFEPNTVATRNSIQEQIETALAIWEPRIVIESVDVQEDPSDPETAIATIAYKLVATQTSERLTVAVALAS
jgi:uncharacterized protein